MSQLKSEIDQNAARFFVDWTTSHAANVEHLKKEPVFLESYRRLVAFQALKTYLVAPKYSAGSAAFFFEAHNDALTSHVAASAGSWRSSLQLLRSCIENVLCALYYKDHSVELELWEKGKFLIGFSDLIKYIEKHPSLNGLSKDLTSIEVIKNEYTTLSKAVHGSNINFRMTDPASNVLLWSVDKAKASSWGTRQQKTLQALTMIIICLDLGAVQGTMSVPLRSVLGYLVKPSLQSGLKDQGVVIEAVE